jgi:acyl-CoA synthetase (AMP-forming)/AMP-acid ligase II
LETLGTFIDSVATAAGDRELVAYAPAHEVTARLSGKELRRASRDAAKKLLSLGARRGTRIGLLCSNRLEWLPIAFGALRIGAVLVPFSTLWKRDEIAYALRHADVETLITLPHFLKHDYLATLHEIVPELAACAPGQLFAPSVPMLRRVVILDGPAGSGVLSWDDADTGTDDDFLDAIEQDVRAADWATIFFTSGTTAQAKAVLHAHHALVVSARRIADSLGIQPSDSWWGHMPLFWSGGFVLGALTTLAGGGRVVLQERVEPAGALQLLEQEGCTIMAGWHQAGPLLDHPDFAKHRLKLIKGSYHPQAERLLGSDHLAVGMYGMSETATCVACARWDDPKPIRVETFGRPLAGMQVKIVDPDTGALAPTGSPGEILVKGPTLMEGYYKVAREQCFDREGFFKTGDLGFFDQDGYLHFANRLKDVIKTAGVNVAAVEVEDALQRHAAVKSAHVVGVPHPVRGENIAAFVILHDGAAITAESLQEHCKVTLASYKVPRHIFLITDSDLPRTGSGKIAKTALRQEAARRLDAPASDAHLSDPPR